MTSFYSLHTVKYYHTDANIAIIKVPRDDYKKVRAAIMLITQIDNEPVSISVKSVHGSARTCKMCTLRIIRKWFHEHILQKHGLGDNNNVNGGNGDDCEHNKNRSVPDSWLKELHGCMEEVCLLD